MDITRKIAKARFQYHTNMLIFLITKAEQIGILKDEKAEMAMKNHAMKSFDCLERMGYDVKDILSKKEEPQQGSSFFYALFGFRRKTGSFMEKRERVVTHFLSPFYFCRKEVISWPEVPDLRADFKTV